MRQFITGRTEIGFDEPSLICTVAQDVQMITVKNIGDEIVYFGGPQVLSWSENSEDQPDSGENVGFPLGPGESQDIQVYDSDSIELHAITASDTVGVVAYIVSSG